MEFSTTILKSFDPSADAFVFMWAILVAGIFAITIILERTTVLMMRAGYKVDLFVSNIISHLRNDDTASALKLCLRARRMALAQVLKSGLDDAAGGTGRVRSAVEEAMLRIVPDLERRTGSLAVIGNISTLLGLLGTVYGLILSFAAVGKPGIDAAQKSELLAAGIAAAMNSTFCGLTVAIMAILAYAFLKSKTQRIIDELDENALRVVNVMVEKTHKVRKYHIATAQLKEGVGIHVLPGKVSVFTDSKLIKEITL